MRISMLLLVRIPNLPLVLVRLLISVSMLLLVRMRILTQILVQVRASVGASELSAFEDWNRLYGSFHNKESMKKAFYL